MKRLGAFLIAWGALASLSAFGQVGSGDWKLETLRLKNGTPLAGFLAGEDKGYFYFQCVVRKPGAPTLIFHEAFERKEVEGIERLPPADREQLRTRLEALAKERQRLSATLRSLDGKGIEGFEAVALNEGVWRGPGGGPSWVYESRFFLLESNAKKGMAQLAAIQLEMAFTAYAKTLPPRRNAGGKPRVLFFRSLEDYQAALKIRGLKLANPAFFDAKNNEILCGSDLERLLEEKEKLAAHHAQVLTSLKKKENELREVYKNKVPADLLLPFVETRRKIIQAENANDATLRLARNQLFQRLYHEAFHAYLATVVYPPAEADFPRWLNEGLAQVFETAVFEVGELRVGHADKERLEAVRLALAKKTFPPLEELLVSKPNQFLVTHQSTRGGSDRYYLASWALAFHLAFEKKLLGKPALEDYVKELKKGASPVAAFEKLTGQPLENFASTLEVYLKGLRTDGTSKPPG